MSPLPWRSWAIYLGLFTYLLLGTVQIVAIGYLLQSSLQWDACIAWGVAYLVAYIPCIGTVAAALAAHVVWRTSLEFATLAFGVPLGVALLALLAARSPPFLKPSK